MITKHTPGPWEIFHAHDHCPEDDYPSFVIGPRQFHTVAQVRPGNIDDDLPAETPANSRLIAAAPELLTHLVRVISQFDALENNLSEVDLLVIDEAKAAIAKATGEDAP